VKLRLTSKGSSGPTLNRELDALFKEMSNLVSEWVVADEDISLQEIVFRLLQKRGATLGTAESCTGGYIAHLLTSLPGSSSIFKGGIVSYANEVKEDVLNVAHETLLDKGAVSEATVREMAAGALKQLKTDYVIATSGIMGPGGGTMEKPVGLVWIAVGDHNNIEVSKHHFHFDRRRNIELTANQALNLLRKFILQTPG
jgi:nicotinamide-nucleotide amidase